MVKKGKQLARSRDEGKILEMRRRKGRRVHSCRSLMPIVWISVVGHKDCSVTNEKRLVVMSRYQLAYEVDFVPRVWGQK